MTQYFGKYRGSVVGNTDPLLQGRLQIACPFVLGAGVMAWAMPCVPLAGILEGFYMMPMIGTQIWVEFERGDPNLPIWSGCFWGPGQVPPNATSPLTRTIRTQTAEVTLDAAAVTLKFGPPTGPGVTVTASATGVEITVGAASIRVDPKSVNVNNGALEIM